MNPKYRYLIAISAFILLASCFVVMAQDAPTLQGDDQKIGDLEQEVIELQNRIQALKSGTVAEPADNEIPSPQPADDSGNRFNANAPAPNSVYSPNVPNQATSPAPPAAPQFGYNRFAPAPPWGAEPPRYGVPTLVEHYVPVQVPVYVEAPPCLHYEPICDPYLPPAIGLQFSFGGYGNHSKHKKHKH